MLVLLYVQEPPKPTRFGINFDLGKEGASDNPNPHPLTKRKYCVSLMALKVMKAVPPNF